MKKKINKLQQMLDDSQRIVFFTGAGVSTDSHIPDFRSAGGIFMKDLDIEAKPEQVLSQSFFDHHPKAFFNFYFDTLVYPQAQPNSGHRLIADLEQAGKDVSVVTQNIDGLHQQAGSTQVYELHGSVWRNFCTGCGKFYTYEKLNLDDKGIPRCVDDNHIIRPDVVLYGQALDETVIFQAIQAISQADMLVVAGSSLSVYPAADFIQYYSGNRLVVINKSPLHMVRQANLVFEEGIGHVVQALNSSIK